MPLGDDARTPGVYPGQLTVFPPDGAIWTEEVRVDVVRVDGLFDTMVPMDEWRATARLSHHDATTDLDGTVAAAPYCYDFAICI